jgi:hypothetical protein
VDIINQCVSQQPEDRPSLEEIIENVLLFIYLFINLYNLFLFKKQNVVKIH